MEFFEQFSDFVLHIDKHLEEFVNEYHKLTYLILAFIIFCEAGLVVLPFLPGDSLLFAAGALAGAGLLKLWILIPILFVAAFIGDNINFAVRNFLGEKIVTSKRRIIKNEWVKSHFSLVTLGIIGISVVPVIIGFLKSKYSKVNLRN